MNCAQPLASPPHTPHTTRSLNALSACASVPPCLPVQTLAETALKDNGGKQVVELGGSRVLIVGVGEDVYAVSNKCSHLGLPIVGKTAVFQVCWGGVGVLYAV